MPGKWPDQTLDQAFGLPEVLVAVSTSRLSCKRAGKTRTLMPVWDSSGESRSKPGRTTMNRRSVFSASAIAVFGLAVMTGGAVGQQKSLKEQLVGTWSFASAITTRPDGSKVETFGPNPGGLLIFDSNGRYASLVVRQGVPKFASNSREAGTAEE